MLKRIDKYPKTIYLPEIEEALDESADRLEDLSGLLNRERHLPKIVTLASKRV